MFHLVPAEEMDNEAAEFMHTLTAVDPFSKVGAFNISDCVNVKSIGAAKRVRIPDKRFLPFNAV